MKRSLTGVAAIIVAIACLSGCAPEPEPLPSPVPTTEPAAPVATPTPTPTPEVPTCENIVSEETLEVLDAEGFTLIASHERDVRNENRVEAKFFDYGGVDCLWGIAAGGDSMATFGYSKITASDATAAQAWLDENGYLRAEAGTTITYNIDPKVDVLGHGDIFVFDTGAWYHANHADSIEEIRSTVG